MKKLNKIFIDYSLFDRYDDYYFQNNLIIPIYENEMVLKLAICNESNLLDIKTKFNKTLSFIEFTKEEIEFFISNLEFRKKLRYLSNNILNSTNSNNSLDEFFQEIILFSIVQRASDIHIESSEDITYIRLRIDGRMKSFFIFPSQVFRYLSSYIKLISNLDITQTRLPLDSRFSLSIDNKTYDFRVSTMPTVHSESIVLRVLDKKNINKNLNSLGFSDDLYSQLKKIVNLSQGLVLIAGPTGSGKTTTLYSLLEELKDQERKIITVEDPVEYKIDDISQISVNNKIGLSFEVILKNILRQDPDVIFIGEIRDKFSLDIALQASLTGHLVIATIHANDAIQTISRLVDLKADPFLLSTTLKYVLSQRLVLNYCKKCDAKGCEKCNYSRYFDRSCIAELLYIDDEISSMIFKKSQINDIKEYLNKIKFRTILKDGFQKVQNNVTSLDEVYKVI